MNQWGMGEDILVKWGTVIWLISVLLFGYLGYFLARHGGLLEARLVVAFGFILGSLISLWGSLHNFSLRMPQPALFLHSIAFSFAVLVIGLCFIIIAVSRALEGEVSVLVGVFYGILIATAYIVLTGGVLTFAGPRFFAALVFAFPLLSREKPQNIGNRTNG